MNVYMWCMHTIHGKIRGALSRNSEESLKSESNRRGNHRQHYADWKGASKSRCQGQVRWELEGTLGQLLWWLARIPLNEVWYTAAFSTFFSKTSLHLGPERQSSTMRGWQHAGGLGRHHTYKISPWYILPLSSNHLGRVC